MLNRAQLWREKPIKDAYIALFICFRSFSHGLVLQIQIAFALLGEIFITEPIHSWKLFGMETCLAAFALFKMFAATQKNWSIPMHLVVC